jgi:hypothetical protein
MQEDDFISLAILARQCERKIAAKIHTRQESEFESQFREGMTNARIVIDGRFRWLDR